MSAVRALAPAKVNPWLEVLRRREDGFHEVDLGMLALDLADVVSVRLGTSDRIEVTGPAASPDVPADETNLAWRAAAAVRELAGGGPPLELVVEKHVPSRAGLGGGSSDAAAAALAAARILGMEAEHASLPTLLAKLGSDCVFFHDAAATGFARCRGRGERVEPIPIPDPRWFLSLVVPSVPSPTGAVYGALEFPLSPVVGLPSFQGDLFLGAEEELRAATFNRLEQVALKTVPELSRWRDLLDRCDAAHFRLSGSGSAFFGFYRERERAVAALEEIEASATRSGLSLRDTRVAAPSTAGARLAD